MTPADRCHLFPLAAVTRADLTTLHHRLRKTPGAANRCLALLSKLLMLAEEWGLRPAGTNPARGLQCYRERQLERFLSGEELARLETVLAQAEARRTEHASVIAGVRLLIFTEARLGEILGLRWEDIDWERGVARLPDSKTGAKLLRLPAPAVDILRSLPRTDGNLWVLPGKRQGKPLNNPPRPWSRLCAAAGQGCGCMICGTPTPVWGPASVCRCRCLAPRSGTSIRRRLRGTRIWWATR